MKAHFESMIVYFIVLTGIVEKNNVFLFHVNWLEKGIYDKNSVYNRGVSLSMMLHDTKINIVSDSDIS